MSEGNGEKAWLIWAFRWTTTGLLGISVALMSWNLIETIANSKANVAQDIQIMTNDRRLDAHERRLDSLEAWRLTVPQIRR